MLSLESLSRMNWREYCKQIEEDAAEEERKWHRNTLEKRLEALEKAGELFGDHRQLSKIDDHWRPRIAGYKDFYGDIEWHWFGDTSPHGYFKQAIRLRNLRLSEALDCIPLTGPVSAENFKCFAKRFLRAFEKAGIATATRLLVYKRPDYFVSFNKESKDKLCETFGVRKKLSLYDYWDGVIEPILDMDMEWWHSPKPEGKLEERMAKCRVAMLDINFYSSIPKHVDIYSL